MTSDNRKYTYHWEKGEYPNCMYDTKDEALKDAIDDAKVCGKPQAGVYISIGLPIAISWDSNEEQIIQSMDERLNELTEDGESLEISVAMEFELAKMIDETVAKWVEKNKLSTNRYSIASTNWHCFEHLINPPTNKE